MDKSYEANKHDFHRSDDERTSRCVECGFDSSHPYHQPQPPESERRARIKSDQAKHAASKEQA